MSKVPTHNDREAEIFGFDRREFMVGGLAFAAIAMLPRIAFTAPTPRSMVTTHRKLGPLEPAGYRLSHRTINDKTRFDTPGYSDYRLTNPRFTPAAIKANMPMVDLLREWSQRKDATPAQISLCLAVGPKAVDCAHSWNDQPATP